MTAREQELSTKLLETERALRNAHGELAAVKQELDRVGRRHMRLELRHLNLKMAARVVVRENGSPASLMGLRLPDGDMESDRLFRKIELQAQKDVLSRAVDSMNEVKTIGHFDPNEAVEWHLRHFQTKFVEWRDQAHAALTILEQEIGEFWDGR